MMISKNQIVDILKTIKYPGFSRDIISFGLIKNIEISNKDITITLYFKSNDSKIVEKLKYDINSEISDKIDFDNLNINVEVDKIQSDFENNKIEGIKNIIAVGSAKGGVGKSTIAINIASQLSKTHKVGFLDLDIYGPSLPLMVGTKTTPKIINNQLIPIEKFNMKLMSFGFLNDEAAPTIWRGPMVSRMTEQFFAQVEWGELDILFLDLPPGTGDIQLTLVQKIALSGAVIITTPQDLALLDVKKASDMFNKLNTQILGVVENMSNLHLEGEIYNSNGDLINGFIKMNNKEYNIKDGLFSVDLEIFKGKGGDNESHRLNVPLLSCIPIDSNLALSTDQGTPYVDKHKNTYIKSCYDDISNKIIQGLGI